MDGRTGARAEGRVLAHAVDSGDDRDAPGQDGRGATALGGAAGRDPESENFSKFLSRGDPWSKGDPWKASAEGRGPASRVTAHGKQSGSGARGPHVGDRRQGGDGGGAGDWSQYRPARGPPEARRGALGPQGAREIGDRPISQPGITGTLTPESKRRPAEAMPSPQGYAKAYRPGSWTRGEPATARFEKPKSALIQALALEPPAEGQLTRALENYEEYHGLDRGTATVNDLRLSKHSLSTWAHYDLAELDN